ncbi:MAG: signal peptide peptidase SppA [Candidatus Odinarchaeota archaeon]
METLIDLVLLGFLLILAFIAWSIIILAVIQLIISIISFILSPMTKKNRVGVINIHGTITSLNESKRPSPGVTYEAINKLIDRAVTSGVIGMIFDIDSPGGQVAASFKIAKRITDLKLPTIAVIKDSGASGGYLIASACNKIIADEWSSVGSIGVILPLVEGEELFKKIGIGYYPDLKVGKYKDLGLPYKRLKDEEIGILKRDLDETYDSFIEFVAKQRNMDKEVLAQLATGETYLGRTAQRNGLVDVIGDRITAKEEMKKLTGKPKIREVHFTAKPRRVSLFQGLIDDFIFKSGKTFAQGFRETIKDELNTKEKIEL